MIQIILLEDNPVEAMLFESALADISLETNLHQVENESSILQLLDSWQSTPSSDTYLLILDMYIGEKSGLEIYESIKGHSIREQCIVAIFTGLTDEKIIQKSYECGVNTYLDKPMDYDELVDMLHKMLLYFSQF